MRYVRLILLVLLSGLFLFLAYNLYQRQQHKYTFLSFRLSPESTSVLVPDLDRLLGKLNRAEDLEALRLNSALQSGLAALLSHKSSRFNPHLGQACFASFTATDFVLAFENPDLDFSDLTGLLVSQFNQAATYENDLFQLNGNSYHAAQYGAFTVLSTLPVVPNFEQPSFFPSNADYLVFKDTAAPDRYILANDRQFRVWNETGKNVRGNPIVHQNFIYKVPKGFESVHFYGSTRLAEDKQTFFNAASEEAYSWVGDGLMILKKGAFELLIAPQNDVRDLRLMLEEQTLAAQGDTVQLNLLNIKNYEIMPFISDFDWEASIPVLNQKLNFYTEFENFNVLANSLEAMRWYLAEIQAGNLIEEDPLFAEACRLSTPLKSHRVDVYYEKDNLVFETYNWIEKSKCTRTSTRFNLNDKAPSKDDLWTFIPPFAPAWILPYAQKETDLVLVANKTNLALYTSNGSQNWQISLGGNLIESPQLVDLENDGIFEIALFLDNEFLVVNNQGKTVNGLAVKMTEPLKGGLCINYDLGYDYRFFLIIGKTIRCLNEKGEIVTGWQYPGNKVPLSGEAIYTQVQGKDYLCFKDVNNELVVLNRRGEDRFTNNTASNLSWESNFVTGKNEDDLQKLGYKNQYIFNRYIKDGYTDSVKLDKSVNAMNAKWLLLDEPTLLIEEPNRMILFNTFGYVKQEILKPQNAQKFLGIHATPQIRYVFFDNSNNSLYLLNVEGKMILSNLSNSTEVYGINSTRFYTFDGQKVSEYKLN